MRVTRMRMRPRLLPPHGRVAHRPADGGAGHSARKHPALERRLPLVLILCAAQVVPRLEAALGGRVPDGREARLPLVLVDVEVGELPGLLFFLVGEVLVLFSRQERLRLVAADVRLLLERRVEAVAAERDNRDVLRPPAAARQVVETLLVLGRREAVVGRDGWPAVLHKNSRVENLVAGGIAVHLHGAIAGGGVVVERGLILRGVAVVHGGPLRALL